MENHYISIDNRQKITITQVADVDAFDEDALWANLKEGSIVLCGQNLNIEKLDLNEGILIVTGKINSLVYSDKKQKKAGGFSSLFSKRTEK